MTSEEYLKFATYLYESLTSMGNQMLSGENEVSAQQITRIINGYEFFRVLRGEGFTEYLPKDMGEIIKDFFTMESELGELVNKLKPLIYKDPMHHFFIKQAQDAFEPEIKM